MHRKRKLDCNIDIINKHNKYEENRGLKVGINNTVYLDVRLHDSYNWYLHSSKYKEYLWTCLRVFNGTDFHLYTETITTEPMLSVCVWVKASDGLHRWHYCGGGGSAGGETCCWEGAEPPLLLTVRGVSLKGEEERERERKNRQKKGVTSALAESYESGSFFSLTFTVKE